MIYGAGPLDGGSQLVEAIANHGMAKTNEQLLVKPQGKIKYGIPGGINKPLNKAFIGEEICIINDPVMVTVSGTDRQQNVITNLNKAFLGIAEHRNHQVDAMLIPINKTAHRMSAGKKLQEMGKKAKLTKPVEGRIAG